MRYVAAYLLAALGGNTEPSASDIKNILGSVGIDVDDDKLNIVLSELKGKNLEDVIAAGQFHASMFGKLMFADCHHSLAKTNVKDLLTLYSREMHVFIWLVQWFSNFSAH